MEKAEIEKDGRICCELKALVNLQGKVNGFSFLPKHVATSKLAGRHGSKFRGRGINFEELRAYRVGDDIRNIDWRVTLKTGSPHVRAYSEEKDHSVILCIDQTDSMFFSSVDTMKSVVAAEIGALCAWRALSDNDRVGAVVMGQDENHWFSPKRGEKHVTHMLGTVAKESQNLLNHTALPGEKSSNKLPQTMDVLLQRGVNNSVLIFISDFYYLSPEALDKLRVLQARNDVLCIHISDALEKNWAPNMDMIFSDGVSQVNVADEEEKVREYFTAQFDARMSTLSGLLRIRNLPLIDLDTSGSHIKSFITQISGVASNG